MASANEIDRYGLINSLGADEIPRGGKRGGSREFRIVDINNREIDPPEGFLEKPDPQSDSSPQYPEDTEGSYSGPPVSESTGPRGSQVPEEATEEGERTAQPAPVPRIPKTLVDLEYGQIKIKSIEVEYIGRGDNQCLLVATRPGSPFSFEMDRGEVCTLETNQERINAYSTGLRANIGGMIVSVFVSIPEDPD